MARKPNVNSASEVELEKVEKQFEAYDENVKALTHDRMRATPVKEVEEQTKISQTDLAKKKDIYLKPKRSISSAEKFNETYRDQWTYDKEYVQFIAEHKELIGETIEIWTKPYAGVPAEEWAVPTNKPVWAPRYLAEQIKRKSYSRLKMEQSIITGTSGEGTYHGGLVVDTQVQRLDARPVSTRKSVFMGANNF